MPMRMPKVFMSVRFQVPSVRLVTDQFRRFFGRDGMPNGFAFEQIKCGGMEIRICQDRGVAWIARVSRSMSLADAFLLAREFKGVKEEGDAEDAEGSF